MRFDAIEMNGPLLGKQGANIASASTVDLATATGNSLTVTGTTTITSFGTVQEGAVFALTFAGALTLTYNATSLILPTAANITTAAGDVMVIQSLGSGNWKCISYTRANGKSLFPFIESVTGLTVDNTDPVNPIIKPVYSFIATAPTVDDDVDLGYLVGSRVVAQDTQIEYLCTQNTDGDAIWQPQSGDNVTFPDWNPSFTPDSAIVYVTLDTYPYLFSRQGNVVTLSFAVFISFDFGISSSGSFTMDPSRLPIPTTTMNAMGVGVIRNSTVISSWVNDGFFSFFSDVLTGTLTQRVTFTIQYSVN